MKLSCSCCLLPSHNHTPGYKLICANLQQYILQSRDSGVIKPRWKAIASFCHSELLGKWLRVRGRGGVQIAACSWLWPKTKLIHRFRSIPNPLSLDYQCTFLTDDDVSPGGNVIGDGVGFIGSGLEVVEEERGAGRDEAGWGGAVLLTRFIRWWPQWVEVTLHTRLEGGDQSSTMFLSDGMALRGSVGTDENV